MFALSVASPNARLLFFFFLWSRKSTTKKLLSTDLSSARPCLCGNGQVFFYVQLPMSDAASRKTPTRVAFNWLIECATLFMRQRASTFLCTVTDSSKIVLRVKSGSIIWLLQVKTFYSRFLPARQYIKYKKL